MLYKLHKQTEEEAYSFWCDLVLVSFSDQFTQAHYAWVNDLETPVGMQTQLDKWLQKLCFKGTSPLKAAKLIQRAHNIYLKPKK